MTRDWNRREVLTQLAGASAALMLPRKEAKGSTHLRVVGEDCEVQLTSVSAHTLRLSILPIKQGIVTRIPFDGSLVETSWGTPDAKLRGEVLPQTIECGDQKILFSPRPLAFTIATLQGQTIQQLSINEETGVVSFLAGDSPLLGLGEGGPQFDRRGSTDRMRSGQGGYQLATHGGRVPIPWLVGTAGWAMFIHQPFGTFDFTGQQSEFLPASLESALPLDIFFVASCNPATIMAEYARLTGRAEMPPLWSFGYQQSHRTLASREEILAEAKTFREKKASLRRADLPGHRFLSFGLEYAKRFLRLEFTRVSRS